MTYATLMVHLTLGQANTSVLRVAAELAARFGAGVIGIAACRPLEIIYSDGCYVSGDLVAEDEERVQQQLEDAEVAFRNAFTAHEGFIEWRSTVVTTPLVDYMERESRSADLLVTGSASDTAVNRTRRVSAGPLVMQLGRPVMVVPEAVESLRLDRVLVCWRDTREARRAASNALPLFKQASRVSIVEIAPENEMSEARGRLEDVAAWFGRHGIKADTNAVATDENDAKRLAQVAQDYRADLIVAGAYGHARAREWALGGVTRDLLLRSELCSLLSH